MLTQEHKLDPVQPYLSREYGVARYEPLRGADFAAGDQYFERTRQFWDDVHAAWADLYHRNPKLTLHLIDDTIEGSDKLFEYAEQLADGRTPQVPAAQVIRESLQGIGAPAPAASNPPGAARP